MVSKKLLNKLPEIKKLRDICKSIAMLDAIIEPEWQYRYYSFNSHWKDNAELAFMRNGSGDDYVILFNENGCFIKGNFHESEFANDYDKNEQVWINYIPKEFSEIITDFDIRLTTFCMWRIISDDFWKTVPLKFPNENIDYDGSQYLLQILDGNPKSYKIWAEDYHGTDTWNDDIYEESLNLNSIKHIYAHKPLTEKVIKKLNPNLSIIDLSKDIKKIGYPSVI